MASNIPNAPVGLDGRDKMLVSLQDDLDNVLNLLDHDPSHLQLDDIKNLLATVRGFVEPGSLRDELIIGLQSDLDDVLTLFDHDPSHLQLDEVKDLLARVHGFFDPRPQRWIGRPLPEELMDIILSFCSSDTLKSSRLASNTLHRIATPYLFNSVHIALIEDVLNNFIKIAAHAQLSKHVKHLVFHCQYPKPFEHLEEWERHIDLRPRPPGSPDVYNPFPPGSVATHTWSVAPKHAKCPVELQEHYKHYMAANQNFSDVLRWHSAMQDPETDVVAYPMHYACDGFYKAVTRLSNLETAELDFDDYQLHGDHPFWKSIQKKILMTPSQWTACAPYNQDECGDTVIQLPMLLGALGDAAGKNMLKSLKMRTDEYQFWTQDHLWHGRSMNNPQFNALLATLPEYRANFDVMSSALVSLSHLDIDVVYALEMENNFIADRTAEFLHKAVNLDRLQLRFRDIMKRGFRRGDPRCDLLERLQDITLPRLKELHHETLTSERSLVGFLKCFAPTLRSIKIQLSGLRPDSGSWESVIAQFPRILNLETVSLIKLYDKGTGQVDPRGPTRMLFVDREEIHYTRALHDFMTGKAEHVMPLDIDDFYEVHESECSCRTGTPFSTLTYFDPLYYYSDS